MRYPHRFSVRPFAPLPFAITYPHHVNHTLHPLAFSACGHSILARRPKAEILWFIRHRANRKIR